MPMVDIDWLKDHVEVPEGLTYEQLAKDLVKVGLEEEEIHTSQVTGPIVVGYVVDATPEPQKNGKIINWCHVDVGDEYNETDENGNKVPRGIICGAPNMAAGEKVVVTLPGAVLPGDFKIEPRKTYGHISNGMCASERELGLGDSHDGIILLRNYGFTDELRAALRVDGTTWGFVALFRDGSGSAFTPVHLDPGAAQLRARRWRAARTDADVFVRTFRDRTDGVADSYQALLPLDSFPDNGIAWPRSTLFKVLDDLTTPSTVLDWTINITFTFKGVRCREPLSSLPVTSANLKYAERLLSEILGKIERGTFNYADYFPASSKLKIFGNASSSATVSIGGRP